MATARTLPLLAGFRAGSTVGWRGGKPVSAAQFCAAARELAAALPARRHVLNLCGDRLTLALGFVAAMLARQVSLLPQSRAPGAVRDLLAAYPESYCLADHGDLPAGLPAFVVPPWRKARAPRGALKAPAVPADQPAVIAFTSGSTGRPQPHVKTWGSLVTGARLQGERLRMKHHGARWVLGTVPPQHLYGFETTVLLPLLEGLAMHSGQPLLPADIAAALHELPGKPWLVTTPAHLHGCVAASIELKVAGLVCATMPLAPELAAAVQRLATGPLYEFYGATETGVVASRRPTVSTVFRVKRGMRLSQHAGETWIEGGQLAAPARLLDHITLQGPTRFKLLGRPEDMVKVAGKRTSLEALNRELLQVRGVRDGAFFIPDEQSGRGRLAAVAVAPGLDAAAILRALRERIDAAFLPRPLLLVERLPRNATGKLPRASLLALARRSA